MKKINKNGFSLLESVISLMVVAIVISGIYFSLQSYQLFNNNKNERINNYHVASNAYSEYIIESKINNKEKINGTSLMLPISTTWLADIRQTNIPNIKQFSLKVIDPKGNEKKINNKYYLYAVSK